MRARATLSRLAPAQALIHQGRNQDMLKFTTVIALAIGGSALAQQQLLLPFNHHYAENATNQSGSTSFFRTTAGRFQVLYDAQNFLNSGVSGPITINRLRFRGEDGEPNHGGQTYSNVTVQLGSTSLSAAAVTWSTTWATNWLPATTTAGAVGTMPTLVVGASNGTVPNNDCIDIDLASLGASITFDPTSAQPNLLIEIIMPTAPVATLGTNISLIAMQDTTGTAVQLFGSCRTSSSPAGTTGTTVNPPVVGVEFAGAGGYGTLLPARVESYGAACGGSAASFYEVWGFGQSADLPLAGLTLTPDNVAAPNVYTVTAGAGAFDPSKVNAVPDNVADDGLVAAFALGYTFNFPGGSTTQIKPCTNGYVWLDGTSTAATGNPTPTLMLGNTSATPYGPRLAVCWHDLHAGRNTTTHPGSGLHVQNDTSGGPGNTVTYVTWLNVGKYNVNSLLTTVAPHAVYNLQCAIYEATGVVEYRYGSCSPLSVGGTTGNNYHTLVGFSPGRIGGSAGVNSVDPQSRDLAFEVPFTTGIEGAFGHIGLVPVQATTVPATVPGRMFDGQSITWNAVGVPAGALFGAQMIDLGATRPGLQFPGITAPGCMFSLTSTAMLWETFLFPTATTTGTVPFTVPGGYNPAILGATVTAQFVLLDGLFTGGDLISASSHALLHTVGLQ